jgi:hypothetical protein
LPAHARDVVFEGHRTVAHTIVLEGDPGGYQLMVAPTVGFGVKEVQVGVPFYFSSKYGSRLWAFRKDVELPTRWEKELFEEQALMAQLPAQIAQVPDSSSLRSVQTRMRLSGLDNGKLELTFVSELRDPPGASEHADLRFVWLGIALLGTVLVLVLGLRRRRREGAPS